MITRRVLVNLSVFLAAAVVLVFFGVVNLLGNPWAARTHIRAVFPDASGLSADFDVTYNGVAVGQVTGVHLVPRGVEVDMSLDPGTTVPDDVRASVDLSNALGEQQVDLTPFRDGPAPALRSGATVPADPERIPASVGRLVTVATRLLDAIPPGDLNTVLHQLALALDGRGGDLRTITLQGRLFAEEFLHYGTQFQQLLANAPPVLDAVSAVGPQLQRALANTAVLAAVLADRRDDLATAIRQGVAAGGDLQAVMGSQLSDLACLTHDFADLTVNIARPVNLSHLDRTLATNGYFFGAVDGVSPAGPAISLYPGDPARSAQYWLRTRLLFPPAQPQGTQYPTTKGLPATKPGAACVTEFGAGVGPAEQAHPSPPGPGGHTVPPAPADSQVRGGTPTGAGQNAAWRRPAGGGDGWPVAAGGLVVVLGWWILNLAIPVDPSGRGRRRLRAGSDRRRL